MAEENSEKPGKAGNTPKNSEKRPRSGQRMSEKKSFEKRTPEKRSPEQRSLEKRSLEKKSFDKTTGRRERPQRSRPSRNRSAQGKPYRKSQRPRRRVTILVNSSADRFDSSAINRFAQELTAAGFQVKTTYPETSAEMAGQAAEAVRERPLALVAVGGDGAVNLVARALIGSDVRLALLPQGKCNNFFRSLIGKPSLTAALEAFKNGATRMIDCGAVSGQPFFTSVGLGLAPALGEALNGRSLPRFGIGWSRLASKVAATIERQNTPVRIDAYRFDLEPSLIMASILPYCLGLNMSPTAIPDDGRLEVTLDMSDDTEPLSRFIRNKFKQNHHLDDSFRLYRGEQVIIGSAKGRMLYLDGELISTPTNNLEISVQPERICVCVSENASDK